MSQCYNGGNVTIAHFFFLSLVLLCFPFISLLAECSIPASHNSLTPFYPNIFRANRSFSKYSPQNIPLYYLTFYCLLLLSISFVMLPTINTYKPHSSFLSFPTLVYLALLASIDPLVTSSRFWQVSALLLSRRFLFESLNPWSNSVWECYVESPSTSTCIFITGRILDPTRSTLILTQTKCNTSPSAIHTLLYPHLTLNFV